VTIYAYEAQESWLPTVAGLVCSEVEIGDALLHIHFGTARKDNQGITEADRTISMHGVWRVEHGDVIVAASGDLDAGISLDLLKGKSLERFDVSQPGFDLDLYFAGGITVRSFPCDSTEYAEDIAEDTDFPISWWVDGDGVPDDWEEMYDP